MPNRYAADNATNNRNGVRRFSVPVTDKACLVPVLHHPFIPTFGPFQSSSLHVWNEKIRSQRDCIWDSTASMRRRLNRKPGPRPAVSDRRLGDLIRVDQAQSPFRGEGHRKVRARLRRQGIPASASRIRRVMKSEGLMRCAAPNRTRRLARARYPAVGRIITTQPNVTWGMDCAQVQCLGSLLYLYFVIEHWNSECLGWNLSQNPGPGSEFDAIQSALNHLGLDRASGVSLRLDHWKGFREADFLRLLREVEIEPYLTFPMRPWQNGVAERFVRTIKEQVFDRVRNSSYNEAMMAIASFIDLYNQLWLLQRLGYRSPAEARFAFSRV